MSISLFIHFWTKLCFSKIVWEGEKTKDKGRTFSRAEFFSFFFLTFTTSDRSDTSLQAMVLRDASNAFQCPLCNLWFGNEKILIASKYTFNTNKNQSRCRENGDEILKYRKKHFGHVLGALHETNLFPWVSWAFSRF